MHHELFVIRIVGFDGYTFKPTNLYITSSFMYHRYVENATYNYRKGIEYLVDSIEDNVDRGVLILKGDEAFYRNGEGLAPSGIRVFTALVPQFDNRTEYNDQDIVYFNKKAYFRKRPGSGNWYWGDWQEIKSGHTLDTLTYYLNYELEGGARKLGQGTFFYGDTLEYAERPFKPGEEEKLGEEIAIIKDINDRFFEQFYAGYVIHDETVLHENF